ncbi:MAG: hypothetical protein ABEJ65_08510, partial [bacterium]
KITKDRLERFEQAVKKYRSDRLGEKAFRKQRLPLGVYYQKPETSWMVRIPLRGGRITGENIRYLAGKARRYEGRVHLTTRQNIQLHCVPLNEVPKLLWELYERGIITYGASGDGIRSIKLPALNGVREGTKELYSLLWKLEDYFLRHPLNMKLPRKFKITVTDSASEQVNLRGEDLGIQFIHEDISNGERWYRVYAGGGLGAIPQRSCQLVDEVEESDLPVLVESVVRFFHVRGNRDNRNRARLKFLLSELGEETFKQRILEKYDELGKENGDEIREQFNQGRKVPAPLTRIPPCLGRNLATHPQSEEGTIIP